MTQPPTLDTETAARLVGVSRWTLRRAAIAGTAPIAPLRVGDRLRWPTRPLLNVLGLDELPAALLDDDARAGA